ncbi:hypothetical protein ACE6H2_007075 [Prunus campanulata]
MAGLPTSSFKANTGSATAEDLKLGLMKQILSHELVPIQSLLTSTPYVPKVPLRTMPRDYEFTDANEEQEELTKKHDPLGKGNAPMLEWEDDEEEVD